MMETHEQGSEDKRKFLRRYVGDMVSVNQHMLEAVRRQAEDEEVAKVQGVKPFIETMQNMIQSNASELEQHLQTLGGGTSGGIRDAVTRTVSQIAGMWGGIGEEKASKALGLNYTALNMAAAGYTMLHTTALGFGDQKTADLALRHLRGIAPLVLELNQVIPAVVTAELSEEGKPINSETQREVVRNVNEAWQVAARESTPRMERQGGGMGSIGRSSERMSFTERGAEARSPEREAAEGRMGKRREQ